MFVGSTAELQKMLKDENTEAKKKLKKSKIFKISELTSVSHNLFLDDLYETGILLDPIEIKVDNHSSVMDFHIYYQKKRSMLFIEVVEE